MARSGTACSKFVDWAGFFRSGIASHLTLPLSTSARSACVLLPGEGSSGQARHFPSGEQKQELRARLGRRNFILDRDWHLQQKAELYSGKELESNSKSAKLVNPPRSPETPRPSISIPPHPPDQCEIVFPALVLPLINILRGGPPFFGKRAPDKKGE